MRGTSSGLYSTPAPGQFRERETVEKVEKNSKRKENTSSARGQFRPVLHTCTRPAKIGITKRKKEKREEGEYLQCEEQVQACILHMHQASRDRYKKEKKEKKEKRAEVEYLQFRLVFHTCTRPVERGIKNRKKIEKR